MTETSSPLQGLPEETRRLGERSTGYKVNPARLLLVLAGGIFFLGLASFVALQDNLSWWRFIPAAICLFYSASFLFQAWHNRQAHVLVYPDGFASWQDGKWITCRWDEIEAVWRDEVRNEHVNPHYLKSWTMTKCFITVVKQGGQHIYFSEFLENIQALGEILVEESYRRLWPKAVEAYQRGDTVEFGPFKINKSGLTHKNRFAPWSEIKVILITPDFIKVIKKGSWLGYFADLPAGAVPNFSVFWTVLEHTGLVAKPPV